MANLNIPAGFGFVAGRNPARARQVLDATAEAGFDENVVLTRNGGYLAPEAAVAIVAAADGEQPGDTSIEGAPDGETDEDRAAAEAKAIEEKNLTALAETTDEEKAAAAESKPAGNASTEAFAEWATKHFGYDPAEGLTRSDLTARYSA